jgi:Peptidase propeptide and YPEB domain
MRKAVVIAAGIASATVLAVAGIASASAATGTPAGTSPVRQATPATPVDQADAERIALAAVPGGTVTETRLETEHGRSVWRVHMSTADGELEVEVEAETGEARIDDVAGQDQDRLDEHGGDRAGHAASDDHGDHGRGDDHGDDHGDDDPTGHH